MAGWIKKSSGKFLGTYKDRYIQLERTEVVVYENEDLKICVERVDLENYDKCHELRSTFKKKNRLVLIRAPNCGNKVHDVKLQAQNPEEKEAWIKAISDGINRAKNKIFDEVKVDESCSLQHATRDRPKGNRGRRPPTRIHMKEIANISSDGVLRLDLEDDSNRPNGTHHVNAENTQKETMKPPMPPTGGSNKEETDNGEPVPEKKVLKPPMPPSQQTKPAVNVEQETQQEEPPESQTDIGMAQTSIGSQDDLSSNAPEKEMKPPTPPSKDKKPVAVGMQEAHGLPDKGPDEGCKEEAEENKEGENILVTREQEVVETEGDPKPSVVELDSTEGSSEAKMLKPEVEENQPICKSKETLTSSPEPAETQSVQEPVKKNTGPPAPPKKKPIKFPITQQANEQPKIAKKDSVDSIETLNEATLEAQPEEPCTVGMSSPAEEREKEEGKSIDSGQHSLEESENNDPATVSGGDMSEDEIESPTAQKPDNSQDLFSSTTIMHTSTSDLCSELDTSSVPKPAVLSTRPPILLKPSSKPKSASMGNLLTESLEDNVKNLPDASVEGDVKHLQFEVDLALEKTGELLDAISSKQDDGEAKAPPPEELLAVAMEKLRKADQFLKEAESLKESKCPGKSKKRISW
ncbi:pleckstrin homology domain-containing family O member 2 isoform X2 [Denticeps clupeoides]|nr:pleckstrin homology domain-containing family O member 2 isoform X2 [Denticeps clupeoides]